MKRSLMLSCALALFSTVSFAAQRDLGAAHAGLQTEYGKNFWADQMQGEEVEIPNELPSGATVKQIADELFKGKPSARYQTPQIVRLDAAKNQYLFLAVREDKYEGDNCGKQASSRLFAFTWENAHATNIVELKNNDILCASNLRILHAPVWLSPTRKALSLMQTKMQGYSGGGASGSALHLIEVGEADMRHRLSTFHGSFTNIAGNWNKDGSRQHDIYESDCVLKADKKQLVNGYYVFKQTCKSSTNGSKLRVSLTNTFRFKPSAGTYVGAKANGVLFGEAFEEE